MFWPPFLFQHQAWKAEYQIRLEFDELHQFLIDEEEARMAALREEENRKSQMLTEENKELSRVVSLLSETVKTVEDDLKAEDLSFLQVSSLYVSVTDQHIISLRFQIVLEEGCFANLINFINWQCPNNKSFYL